MRKQSFLAAALTVALGVASAQSTGPWRTTPNGAAGTSQQNNPAQNGPGEGRPDDRIDSRADDADRNGPDNRRDNRDNRSDAGVARISVADGDVEVLRGDTRDRLPARGGMPMVGNDSISTGRSSRAEVQLGPGNLVRLNEETRMRIVDVGNRYFRIEVLSGTVNLSQLRGGEADVDVMAPNTTVRPLKTGVYRITVREGGQTDLTVRKGEAEIVSSRGGERVKSGHRASVRGERQNPELRVSDAEPKDSFDRWNERRDDVLEPHYRGGGLLYGGYGGGYGGYGYPFWGPRYGGYGYGGFYRPTVVIGGVFGRGAIGGGGGHRGGGRR